jgi:CheY-like chemotaxis protein
MPSRPHQPPPPTTTILIVDDHADTRDAMGLVLTTLGCSAIVAASGAEALTILQDTRPDVILCDVRMPGMDGFDFAKAVRRLPGGAGLKVIAITGVSDRTLATRFLAGGFDGHLVKPVDFEALRTTLDRLLTLPRTA